MIFTDVGRPSIGTDFRHVRTQPGHQARNDVRCGEMFCKEWVQTPLGASDEPEYSIYNYSDIKMQYSIVNPQHRSPSLSTSGLEIKLVICYQSRNLQGLCDVIDKKVSFN